MALDLNEYIKMSYERPNRKVLEGLGASEGLIKYLMETPGNTNWNVIGSIGEGGDIGELWFTGIMARTEYDGGEMGYGILEATDKADILRLVNRPQDCTIFINGEKASPYSTEGYEDIGIWFTGDPETGSGKVFSSYENGTYVAQVVPYSDNEINIEINVICDTTQPIVLQWTGTFKINGFGYENVLIPTDIENNMIPGLYNDTSEDNTLIRIGGADKTQKGISIYSNEEIYYNVGSYTAHASSNHINKYTAKVTIDEHF